MSEDVQGNIYEAVIADLEAKIASLQTMVANLRSLQMMAANISVAAPAKSVPQTVEFGHDAFFGMTIPEAARKFLTATKKTASVPVIADALLQGGLKSSATNFRETVRSIIGRNPEFVRIHGEFGLAEWYPARKGGPKKRQGNSPEPETEMPSVDSPDGNSAKPAALGSGSF